MNNNYFKWLCRMFVFIKYSTPIIIILCFNYLVSLQKLDQDRKNIDYKTDISTDVLVSNQFNENEKKLIKEAASSWESKTKGLVKFHIVYEPFYNIDFTHSIIVIKTPALDPDVIFMDGIKKCPGCTLAITSVNSPVPNIKFVEDRFKSDDQFYSTILHEFGHSIGLLHLEGLENLGAVMFPVVGNFRRELTKMDLKYFCEVYNCNELKRQEILNDTSYQIYIP